MKVASNNISDASPGGTLIVGNMHNGDNYNLGPRSNVSIQNVYIPTIGNQLKFPQELFVPTSKPNAALLEAVTQPTTLVTPDGESFELPVGIGITPAIWNKYN